MLVLGWQLGRRLHEMLRLDRAQAEAHSLKRGYLVTKGKGVRVRKVPVTERAVKSLSTAARVCLAARSPLSAPAKPPPR